MTHPTSEFVSVEITATHALVAWHRIEKRNAFSREMLEAIEAAIGGVTTENPRLPIILSGGPYFSAGADAGEMASDPGTYREGIGRLHIAIGDRIREHPAPVIAAVEGFAFGGALVISSCADFVIAARDARFGLTEARVGLVGGLGVIDDLVGRLAATRLVLLGNVIDADEALALGLLTRLVDTGTALEAAVGTATQLAELNPDTWLLGKRIIRSSDGKDRREAEVEANQSLLLDSADTKARVAKFRKDAA